MQTLLVSMFLTCPSTVLIASGSKTVQAPWRSDVPELTEVSGCLFRGIVMLLH